MMSRQMSTHSAQMYTVGPAMSFLTSRWLLLQKEQRSTSPFPVFFDIQPPAGIETIVGGCRGPVHASTRPFSNLAHPARLTPTHGGYSPALFAVEILGNCGIGLRPASRENAR